MTGVYDASDDELATGHHEYEPFPERRKRGCLGKVVGLLAVLVVLGLVGAGLAWISYQKAVDPAGPPGEPVKLTIPMGSSTQAIGKLLDSAGIITSADMFRYYIRLNRQPCPGRCAVEAYRLDHREDLLAARQTKSVFGLFGDPRQHDRAIAVDGDFHGRPDARPDSSNRSRQNVERAESFRPPGRDHHVAGADTNAHRSPRCHRQFRHSDFAGL